MSQMEVDTDPSAVLAQLRDECDPELSTFFYSLEDLYERKLWYQLTNLLSKEFFNNPLSVGMRLRLYEDFILTFYDKLNQLKLIEFLSYSLLDLNDDDYNQHLNYLETLQKKIIAYGDKTLTSGDDEAEYNDEINQALIFISSEIALIKLKLGLIDDASNLINECSKKIDDLNSVDNKINASFYKTSGELNKIKKDYNAFYYNSLLYLACIEKELDENSLPLDQLRVILNDTCFAALLGDKIYNFGEILMHKSFSIVNIEWLKKLLFALNKGDLKSFQQIVESMEFLSTKEYTDILQNVDYLKRKVCIMAFIGLIFEKPVNDKVLSFNEIKEKIYFLSNVDEVEHLIMKCLSLGLIKGYINEVRQIVEVNWCQPRTMTTEQIDMMKDKLVNWSTNVGSVAKYMDQAGKELWV